MSKHMSMLPHPSSLPERKHDGVKGSPLEAANQWAKPRRSTPGLGLGRHVVAVGGQIGLDHDVPHCRSVGFVCCPDDHLKPP